MKVKLFEVESRFLNDAQEEINEWLKLSPKKIVIGKITQSSLEDTHNHIRSLISIWYSERKETFY